MKKSSYKILGIFLFVMGLVVIAQYFDLTKTSIKIATRLGVETALTDADLNPLELKGLAITFKGVMAFLDSEPGLMDFNTVRDHVFSITPKKYRMLIATVFDIVEANSEFIENKADNLTSRVMLYVALKEAAWVVDQRLDNR